VCFMEFATVHEAWFGGSGYQYPFDGYWFPPNS